MTYELPADQVALLRKTHKQVRGRAVADRIKAVVLLSQGWEATKVAEALLIDERTVRQYFYTFQRHGLDGLMFRSHNGRESYLNSEMQADLIQYLNEVAPATVKEIVVYVREKHNVSFSVSGMTKLLRRLNFVYKKTKSVPSKADEQAQREFIKEYRELRQKSKPTEPVLFMDGCHPIHNNSISYAWIQKGSEKRIKANTGVSGSISTARSILNLIMCKSFFPKVLTLNRQLNCSKKSNRFIPTQIV